LAGIDPIVVAPERDHAQVSLYWQLAQPAQRNFNFTLRLIDRSGAEWGLWQGAAFDNWSAKKWPVGKYVQQAASVVLPHGLPSGDYALLIGVAVRQTNEAIPTANDLAEVEVATVKVAP
jgi:hypothetical protein